MRHATLGLARIVVLATPLVIGCAGATRLATVWSDPAAGTASLRSLTVIAVARTISSRRVFEDRFTAALRARRIEAAPGYALAAEADDLDSARFSTAMRQAGGDAVLVVRVVEPATAPAFRATASVSADVTRHQGGWYGDYQSGMTELSSPRYGHENQPVAFEANLYRLSDGRLVWSARSAEWLGQREMPASSADHFARQLVAALAGARLVAEVR